MTRYSLCDKVVLITGAGRGLGAATAAALAQRGARVVIADIDLPRAQSVAAALPRNRGLAMHCDVTDLASVQESVRLTLEQFGRIDVAIANAGVLGRGGTLRTLLGFTFRTRSARAKDGALFASFQPAISNDAQKKISEQIRRWRLHRRIGLSLADIARWINPVVRGWMQYYGAFYRSALYPLLSRINAYLMRWTRKKYKRLRTIKKAAACWQRITRQYPRLFAHWAWAHGSWWSG